MMHPVLAATLASLVATATLAAEGPADIGVDLKDPAGTSIGTAVVSEAPNGVLIRIQARGLAPGWHGLHLHEKGDCSKADFSSAGPHVHTKPTLVHGLLNPDANEAGDLPNLYAAADGSAHAELFSTYVSLGATASRATLTDKDGSSLVIHAQPDDHKTQPIGGSGARIACGVIAPG